MSTANALATAKSGGLAAFSDGLKNIQNTVKAEGVDDGLFARMNGKTGIWETNYPGTTTFPNGSEFVFNMYLASVIHMGFDDNKKVYFSPKKPVGVASGQVLPDPEPLPPGSPPVRWTKSMRVMIAPGDTGKQIVLSAKADRPFRSIWKLMQQYGQLAVTQPDPGSSTGYKMPIVAIGSEEKFSKVPEKKVVVNQTTGKEEVVSVMVNAQYFVDTYKIVGWITEAEMTEIMEANGITATSAEEPAAVDTVIKADAHAEVKAQAQVEVEEAEIILPPKTQAVPGGAGGSFQRHRAGATGIRTV